MKIEITEIGFLEALNLHQHGNQPVTRCEIKSGPSNKEFTDSATAGNRRDRIRVTLNCWHDRNAFHFQGYINGLIRDNGSDYEWFFGINGTASSLTTNRIAMKSAWGYYNTHARNGYLYLPQATLDHLTGE